MNLEESKSPCITCEVALLTVPGHTLQVFNSPLLGSVVMHLHSPLESCPIILICFPLGLVVYAVFSPLMEYVQHVFPWLLSQTLTSQLSPTVLEAAV